MPDRVEAEIVRNSGDRGNEVRDIDVNQYAMTSVPKGYARIAHVEENCDPTSSDRG